MSGDTSWDHDNPEWQKTLDMARQFGWPAPVKQSNHKILWLRCSAKACSIRIFSTGAGTETKAIGFRTKIKNCAHRDLTRPVTAVRTALDGAEMLIDASDRLLDLVDAEGHVEMLLANLDEAEDQLSEIEAQFDDAAKRYDDAQAAVADSSAGQTSTSAADEAPTALTQKAGSELRSARLTLRDEVPRAHPDWTSLHARHGELTERLAKTRARL